MKPLTVGVLTSFLVLLDPDTPIDVAVKWTEDPSRGGGPAAIQGQINGLTAEGQRVMLICDKRKGN